MRFASVKKWLAMLLAVCMMMALVACAQTENAPSNEDSSDTDNAAAKIAVVFASSGLGDKSFNDALFNGMKEAESSMGIEWVYSEPKDDAEYEGLISGYADSGDCDLIVCLGGSQSSSLENVAPNYPQQRFVILDAVVDGDNIRSYTWRDQELGFLAGFLGASLIYHTASAGGLGILNAGKEKGFLTIFFDGNLNTDAPETNIASAIRDFPACAKEAIQDVIDGKFTAGAIEKGIAEDSLYLDFDGSAYQIPDDVMEQYNAVVAAIKDGTIVVPSTIEDAKVWKAA